MEPIVDNLREKNIVFVGFMGVGKTTVGRLVAKKLLRDFIDIDHVIEDETRMSIPHIFEKFGEAYFRKLEREIISNIVLNEKLKVISLGGGAYMQKEVREICLKHCIVFSLDLEWNKWLHRFEHLKADRPILKNKNLSEIQKLYDERYPIYSICNSSVEIADKSQDTIAEYIVNCLKFGWELYDQSAGSFIKDISWE